MPFFIPTHPPPPKSCHDFSLTQPTGGSQSRIMKPSVCLLMHVECAERTSSGQQNRRCFRFRATSATAALCCLEVSTQREVREWTGGLSGGASGTRCPSESSQAGVRSSLCPRHGPGAARCGWGVLPLPRCACCGLQRLQRGRCELGSLRRRSCGDARRSACGHVQGRAQFWGQAGRDYGAALAASASARKRVLSMLYAAHGSLRFSCIKQPSKTVTGSRDCTRMM